MAGLRQGPEYLHDRAVGKWSPGVDCSVDGVTKENELEEVIY